MNRTENFDRTIRQYLLGELSEPEQAAVESEYIADRDVFEEVCALENDLIDDYVRGNLAGTDREQFERRYFSSPERLSRVQFAGSMLASLYGTGTRASGRRPDSASSRVRGSLAAVFGRWKLRATPILATLALVLAVATGLLALEALRLRRALVTSQETLASQSQKESELERQLTEQRASTEHLAKDLEALRSGNAQEQTSSLRGLAPIIASFILRPGLLRSGGEPQRLLIPAGADVIELRLNLRSLDFKEYTGNLLTPEGAVIWKQPTIKIRPSQTGGTAFMRVPSKLLPPGDYLMRVDGISPLGEAIEVSDCYFRVPKRTH
jgi:hypothetical protein